MRAWLVLGALFFLILARPGLAETRPVVAVVPNEAYFPLGDRMLADAVRRELSGVERFVLVEPAGPQVGSGKSEERAVARASAGGATVAVLVGFAQDPTAQFVRFTDLSGQYVARSDAGVVVLEVPSGKERVRQTVRFYGESPSSKEAAEAYAYEHAAKDIARIVREAYRLSAVITARQGRHVALDHGRDLGLQTGMLFSALSPEHEPVGRIQVGEVATGSAQGEVLSGYYDLKVGETVYEQPYASLPAGAGLLYTGWLDGSGGVTAVSLDYNRTGYGWGASLAFGELRQAEATGFALMPHLVYQHELWPERLWLSSELGLGGVFLSQGIPGSVDRATSYSLHGTCSVGLAGHLFGGLGASIGLTYLTPWRADAWNQSTGVVQPVDVSGRVPHPLVGGLGWTAGLTWAF
ncbi:MAG TPA: hypothetical protein V6D05_11795 [Stenomitos sp.]